MHNNNKIQYSLIFFLCLSFTLFSCYTADDKDWQAGKIATSLQQLFPGADSVLLLNQAEAAEDKRDTIGLPVPLFKAFIKEKNTPGYEFIFYFYAAGPKDTAVFAPLMKSILIHDFKIGLGKKEPDYLVTMPFFDANGASKMLAVALSASTTKDSIYLSNKQQEILAAFALKAMSQKPKLVK